MKLQVLHVLPLCGGAALKVRLETDGWRCSEQEGSALFATHRQVATEQDARCRLSQLGLLTSGRCHIDFFQHHDCSEGVRADVTV